MDKNLAHTLKEKLQDKYERTTLEVLGDSTDPDRCTDFTLYVHFNDSLDNCLAVYSDKKGFSISNFKNLKSPTIKSSTEFNRKTNSKNVEGLTLFFHRCYEEMVKRESKTEAEHKACLSDWRIDPNLYERIEGPIKKIGRYINP